MQNRWVDGEIVGADDLAQLVYLSRVMGSEPNLVLWGGGNTSIKGETLDFRDKQVRSMYIKGSGSDMKDSEPHHFPAIDLDALLPLFERDELPDEAMVAFIRQCMLDPTAPRPSIETLLHAFLPHKCVAHSHADAILSLTNSFRAEGTLGTLFGRNVAIIAYRRPGFLLAKEVAQAALNTPSPQAIILANHGLVTWGTTAKQAYDVHVDLVSKCEQYISDQSIGKTLFGSPTGNPIGPEKRRQIAATVGPTLRGLVSYRQRAILEFDDSPEVLSLVRASGGRELSCIGAATPDHTLHTKRLPAWVAVEDPENLSEVIDAIRATMESYAREYRVWFEAHQADDARILDPYPRVILLAGVGMWTTGRDSLAAHIAGDIYRHTVGIIEGAQAVGGYRTLTPKDSYDAEYWPLELYKLALAPPEKELARRIVLVTGGASGIGRAIARRFAAEGAHVVVTDLDQQGADVVAQELRAVNGHNRAIALRMDVTNESDVAHGFMQARLLYGGIDVVVSNAGVATVGLIEDLSAEDWRRSMEVNATGHFMVAKQAVHLFRQQNIGGNIIFIGTKNVPAPGKDFGAYSASKAAEVQLARVLAVENGEHGIRVNIINPDAVFRDSKLWSEGVRQQRANAHNIAVESLEDFYRTRNLLQTVVTAEDVAETALFFASDRSAKTTGAMMPVDGGLRDAFPR